MPDLARESQGLGQFPALVLVDMIKGFTNPDCALGSDAESVVAANPSATRSLPVTISLRLA